MHRDMRANNDVLRPVGVDNSAPGSSDKVDDVALILVLASTVNGSPGLAKAGGIVVFAFAVVGAYVFAGSLSVATGGKPFPLGRPVIT